MRDIALVKQKLREANFNPATPTVWLAEGLLMYPNAGQVSALLSTLNELSAIGTVFLADFLNAAYLAASTNCLMVAWAKHAAPPCFTCENPANLLATYGFSKCYITALGQNDCNFGRFPSSPSTSIEVSNNDPTPRNLLAVAVKLT